MFLYLGIESSFTSWTPVFLNRERNLTPAAASYSVSIFWLAMIVGRVIFSRISHKVNLNRTLIIVAGGGALFTALSFTGQDIVLAAFFLILSGLCLSLILPGLLALGGGFFSKHIGFITGTMMASGLAGCIFFPWVIGPVSAVVGLARSVFLIPVLSAGLALLILYLRYSSTRNAPRPTSA